MVLTNNRNWRSLPLSTLEGDIAMDDELRALFKEHATAPTEVTPNSPLRRMHLKTNSAHRDAMDLSASEFQSGWDNLSRDTTVAAEAGGTISEMRFRQPLLRATELNHGHDSTRRM